MKLHLDIETYCEAGLKTVGVRKYVEDPSFEILLVGYAFGDGPVKQADLALGDPMPEEVIAALAAGSGGIRVAHNATFERLGMSVWLAKHGRSDVLGGRRFLDPMGWRCTMVRAYQLGLPGSLEKAGVWLGIPADKQKLATGKKLIEKFCKPQKDGRRIFPQAALPGTKGDWETFKDYNVGDVVAERAIDEAEGLYPECPDREWLVYRADQDINDRGVGVDVAMAKTVNAYVADHSQKLMGEARAASGLENPQSMPRAKDWLRSKGVQFDNLSKASLDGLIREAKDPDVKAYLKARKELGKTSVTKYEAMVRAAVWYGDERCWRLHGTLQFDGAIRTGRWAGRIVQTQNLPRNTLDDIAFARSLAANGEFDWLEACYGKPMDTLSQLIRTAFVPKPGWKFAVADYKQIECRVAAWMCGEQYKLDAFASGKDIYKETASRILNKPASELTHDERQKGKVAELAGAYGGGIGAYKRFGADKMGLGDDEIQVLVDAWRENNPEIVAFWRQLETAAKAAISHKGVRYPVGSKGVSLRMDRDTLFMTLPSKRLIAYKGARIAETDDGERIEYLDMGTATQAFAYVETYGGKLFENLIQSTARDCLAEALHARDQGGWRTVFHVHDECITEVPAETAERDLATIQEVMRIPEAEWAKGLPLDSDGYVCDFYKKDD